MYSMLSRGEPRAPLAPPLAAETLDAIGLTATLAERLQQDGSGRAFEPAQIAASEDGIAQLPLLLRREPAGGAEGIIRENARQVQEQAIPLLNRALGAASHTTAVLLQEVLREARQRKAGVEARASEITDRYERIQQRLHRWQEHVGQRSGSLAGDLWRWLAGGPERMSLPEVMTLWNEREYVAQQRAALLAALECFTTLIDTVGGLLSNLDRTLLQAAAARAALSQEDEAAQRQAAEIYAPWTLRIEAREVAAALAAQADDQVLLAGLLRQLGMGDAEADLVAQVRAVARTEMQRLLAGCSITDLIALEAAATPARADDDPIVLVGQALLDGLQRPTWQVGRHARPRVELVQVTPDGAPVYSQEGLSSAAYGADADRLGFVAVQLGVTLHDLTWLRDGEEAFTALLSQRNLFVLEELAAAAGRDL